MRLSKHQFDESQWATPGTGLDYEKTEEVEDEIKQLREFYPELTGWGDLAIFIAWGSYSQDDHDLRWHPINIRDERFLAYLLYLEQGRDIMLWSDEMAQATLADLF